MNAPEWSKNEQSIDLAKTYLRQGGTIDFFELISKRILEGHPKDLASYSLALVNDILDGKEIDPVADFHPKKTEDNEYMANMNVCEFLDQWVLALLEERPGSDVERLAFHKQYLESLVGRNTENGGRLQASLSET